MAKIDPPYDDYQKRAGERQILVVVLDPVDRCLPPPARKVARPGPPHVQQVGPPES